MTIEPRPLTAGRRADIEFGIRKGIYGGNFAACYAHILYVERELTAAQERINALEAGIRGIAERPSVREANPYTEIADMQIQALRLLEEEAQ